MAKQGNQGGGQSRHTLVLDLDTSMVNEKLRSLRQQIGGAVGGRPGTGSGAAAGAQPAGRRERKDDDGGSRDFARVYAVQELTRAASTLKDIALMGADPYATSTQRAMGQTQAGVQLGATALGGMLGAAGGPMGVMAGASLGGTAGEFASGMLSNQFKAQVNAQEGLRAVFERENTFRAQHGLDPLTDDEVQTIKDELKPMFAAIERAKIQAGEQVGEGPSVIKELGNMIENVTLDALGELGKAITGASEDAREFGRAIRSAMVLDFGSASRILESARNEADRAANGTERPGGGF